MISTSTIRRRHEAERGFTLIELSIVLVIIGLIVGGVLVGQDLIRAAEVRATISQIEKYNTAVNTFRGKFNAIPGDMNATTATAFGFTTVGTRSATAGKGDGNGVIDGGGGAGSLAQGFGETVAFWEDLSSSAAGNLIDGSFSTGNISTANAGAIAASALPNYFPAAKLGRGNYIYVFESGGTNYYGMSAVSGVVITTGALTSAPSLSVLQAYNIDKKVDDGAPTTGNVIAQYLTAAAITPAPNTATAPPASTDCYDSALLTYAVSVNNGSGANCALSFRFQ